MSNSWGIREQSFITGGGRELEKLGWRAMKNLLGAHKKELTSSPQTSKIL